MTAEVFKTVIRQERSGLAAITVNLSDEMASHLSEAFCGRFNYQNTIQVQGSGMVQNPISSGEFTINTIRNYCLNILRDYNINLAAKAAKDAADQEVRNTIENHPLTVEVA